MANNIIYTCRIKFNPLGKAVILFGKYLKWFPKTVQVFIGDLVTKNARKLFYLKTTKYGKTHSNTKA